MKKPSFLKPKHLSWKCICGNIIPKNGALLSGGPTYKYGYHVHCPKCQRTVAQFVDPKETRLREQQA